MIKKILKKNAGIKRYIEKVGKRRRIRYVQKNGLRELIKVTNALYKNDILAFADFGTLLGLIRDGCLLYGDDDIDIGVIVDSDSTVSSVDKIIKSLGYKLVREFTVDNNVMQRAYSIRLLRIDVHLYFQDKEGTMYCHLFYNPSNEAKETKWRGVIKKIPRFNSLTTITVKKYKVIVPKEAEIILKYKYGENWRIPDDKWNYWEGPNTYPIDKMGIYKSIYNGGLNE